MGMVIPARSRMHLHSPLRDYFRNMYPWQAPYALPWLSIYAVLVHHNQLAYSLTGYEQLVSTASPDTK
jgi:hypothetical protein